MSSELTIEGVEYISSKRASEITGYSQDYVGQLARAGKILGKRVGGLWYIVADSLSGYKQVAETFTPTPPTVELPKTSEDSSVVTFEGKTYVSASRAAKLTSYHQDYIGQLARAGKVLSRQVGKRWYVDIDALKAHKHEKDALLGAVQTASVGIDREIGQRQDVIDAREADPYNVGLHYTYRAEEKPLVPFLEEKSESVAVQEAVDTSTAGEVKHYIPIRVVRDAQLGAPPGISSKIVSRRVGRTSVLSIFSKLFYSISIAALFLIVFNFSLSQMTIPILKMSPGITNFMPGTKSVKEDLQGLFLRIFSKKIGYSRE